MKKLKDARHRDILEGIERFEDDAEGKNGYCPFDSALSHHA
jgi:hypothetical protein